MNVTRCENVLQAIVPVMLTWFENLDATSACTAAFCDSSSGGVAPIALVAESGTSAASTVPHAKHMKLAKLAQTQGELKAKLFGLNKLKVNV